MHGSTVTFEMGRVCGYVLLHNFLYVMEGHIFMSMG